VTVSGAPGPWQQLQTHLDTYLEDPAFKEVADRVVPEMTAAQGNSLKNPALIA
jgi:hypothetical protein